MDCKGCGDCCKGPGYLILRKFNDNLCEIHDDKPKRCEKHLCRPARIEKIRSFFKK